MGFDLGKMTGGLFDSQPSLQTFSTLSKNQQAVDQRMSDYLTSRVGQPMQQYRGTRVADMSPYEQQGLGWLGQYMQGTGQYMPQRQAAYGQALSGNMLPQINMDASRDWFKNQVIPQYQQNFQMMSAPALEQARAMGMRASSSGMGQALAGESARQAQTLGDMGYQYMLQEQQAQRARDELNAQYQMNAAANQEPLRLEQLQMTQASQTLGALPRLLEQAFRDAKFQEWLRTRPELSPVIQQALSYLGIQMQGTYTQENPGIITQVTGGMNQLSGLFGQQQTPTTTTNGTTTQGQSGGGMAGLIQTLGPIIAALSDRRFKTNIVHLGATPAGLPIYSFRYIFGGPTHIGVMAQDALESQPEAVLERGGVLYVNYGLIR